MICVFSVNLIKNFTTENPCNLIDSLRNDARFAASSEMRSFSLGQFSFFQTAQFSFFQTALGGEF